MSKATKRKYVFNELRSWECELPKADQRVVQILESRGNNLHLVRDSDRETFLVSMPTKYRRSVWIKRGDLVLIDPIAEGDKVKGEITAIYPKGSIKTLVEEGFWISDENKPDNSREFDVSEEFVNPNRPPVFTESSDSDED